MSWASVRGGSWANWLTIAFTVGVSSVAGAGIAMRLSLFVWLAGRGVRCAVGLVFLAIVFLFVVAVECVECQYKHVQVVGNHQVFIAECDECCHIHG